jgi:hypothetical protein
MRRFALGLALCPTLAAAALAQSASPPPATNDYPTAARAEYVFACMAANGQTQDALTRCSCSIDQIAGILPYDAYVEAETVLRMRLAPGERGAMFRGTPAVREIGATLRRAQAEAEMLCF